MDKLAQLYIRCSVTFMHCFVPLGPQTFKDHISLNKANEGKNCQLCKQNVIRSEEHLQKFFFKNAVHFKDGDFGKLVLVL